MFGDSHKLDDVVARILDTRQYVPREPGVGSDPLLFLGHAYVSLVNQRRLLRKIGPGTNFFPRLRPAKRLFRPPYESGKILAGLVLQGIKSISGKPHPPVPVTILHVGLVARTVTKPLCRSARYPYFPDTVLQGSKRVRSPVPAVEIPCQEYMTGMREPFPESPGIGILVIMQSEIKMRGSEFVQTAPFLFNPPLGIEISGMTTFDAIGYGPEPFVPFHERKQPFHA